MSAFLCFLAALLFAAVAWAQVAVGHAPSAAIYGFCTGVWLCNAINRWADL